MRHIHILRHAQRANSQGNLVSNQTPITPQGEKLSIELGANCNSLRQLVIYTSPLLRCKQTAAAFAKGYNNPVDIYPNSLFGDPGAYIQNSTLARGVFEKHGNRGVIDLFIEKGQLPGFYSLKEGSEKILSFCQSLKNLNSIIITHDSILAFLAAYLFKTLSTEDVLYSYLNGITIQCASNGDMSYKSSTEICLSLAGETNS